MNLMPIFHTGHISRKKKKKIFLLFAPVALVGKLCFHFSKTGEFLIIRVSVYLLGSERNVLETKI